MSEKKTTIRYNTQIFDFFFFLSFPYFTNTKVFSVHMETHIWF